MTESEATKLVALLQAAYPHRPLPDESVKLYVTVLETIERADGERAVKRAILECQFLPTIAEIREHLNRSKDPAKLAALYVRNAGWMLPEPALRDELARYGVDPEPFVAQASALALAHEPLAIEAPREVFDEDKRRALAMARGDYTGAVE